MAIHLALPLFLQFGAVGFQLNTIYAPVSSSSLVNARNGSAELQPTSLSSNSAMCGCGLSFTIRYRISFFSNQISVDEFHTEGGERALYS